MFCDFFLQIKKSLILFGIMQHAKKETPLSSIPALFIPCTTMAKAEEEKAITELRDGNDRSRFDDGGRRKLYILLSPLHLFFWGGPLWPRPSLPLNPWSVTIALVLAAEYVPV